VWGAESEDGIAVLTLDPVGDVNVGAWRLTRRDIGGLGDMSSRKS
jgi:hypothetical protein